MADAPYAFVTLVTSDHYLPGALAVAAALRDLHPSPPTPPEVPFQTLCLVTPESVDVSSIKLLRRAFDIVIGVEIIAQEDDKGLQLLGEYSQTSIYAQISGSGRDNLLVAHASHVRSYLYTPAIVPKLVPHCTKTRYSRSIECA